MRTKRFVTFLLTAGLLIGLCCVPVFAKAATKGSCGDKAKWFFDASTGTLTISGSGPMNCQMYNENELWYPYLEQIQHVVIEEGITSVSKDAFENHSYIKSVKIADSVLIIGRSAFFGCDDLTDLDLGTGIVTIEELAFNSCFALPHVALPSSLTTLSMEVFSDCSVLKSIALPEGITLINNGLFRNSENLTYIYIPDSVTAVNFAAFRGCNALKDVYFGGTQEQWNAIVVDDTVDEHRGNNEALSKATIHYNHSHSWDNGSVTKPATCSQSGKKTYTCTNCSAQKTKTISKDKHTWDSGNVTAAATCAKEGIKTYTCTSCGTTKTEKLAKLTEHTWNSGIQNADTTVSYSCEKCGITKTEGTPIIPIAPTTPTIVPNNPNSGATNETSTPTEGTAEPTQNTNSPVDKSSLWGTVTGISLVVLVGGTVLLLLWKKKNRS